MQNEDPPFTLEAAWELVRDAVQWLHGLFGPPKYVLHCGTQKKRDHDLMLSWLRSLEALVSRLLLVAAAAVTLPEATKRARRGGKRKFGAWRVRFRVQGLAHARRAHGARTRRAITPRLFPSTHGPAARYEALRRVAENPVAYAVRLARRLKRDAGLPRRMLAVQLNPRDPFAPNAEAAARFVLDVFPDALHNSS